MKNLKIEIKWAVIFIVMMLLWMLMEKMTGLHDKNIDQHATYSNLVALPAIAIYVFALLEKRRKYYNGIMSYKEGFITGLIITIIVTIFTPLTQYITSEIISPEYFTNVTKHAVSTGQMTQKAAEEYFNLKSYVVQSTIGAFLMGLLTTAIVAFFTKTKARQLA